MNRREMLKSVAVGGTALVVPAVATAELPTKHALDPLLGGGLLVGYEKGENEYVYLNYFVKESMSVENLSLCRDIVWNPHKSDDYSISDGFGWGVDISIPWSYAKDGKPQSFPSQGSLSLILKTGKDYVGADRILPINAVFDYKKPFLFVLPTNMKAKGMLRSAGFSDRNGFGVYGYRFDVDIMK